MARYVTTIATTMPPADAFAYMATFSNAAEWDPGVIEASREDSGELRVGSAFRVVSKFAGRPVVLRYVITELDPGRRVVLAAHKRIFGSVDTITVEPATGGSTVTYDARLIPKGVLRLAEPAFGALFRRVGDAAAASLRTRFAAPAPTPPTP